MESAAALPGGASGGAGSDAIRPRQSCPYALLFAQPAIAGRALRNCVFLLLLVRIALDISAGSCHGPLAIMADSLTFLTKYSFHQGTASGSLAVRSV